MGLLEYILVILIAMEILFTVQVISNFRYGMQKHRRHRCGYRPECLLIVPCKGLDETFNTNIESFFTQDYQPYHLRFVVQEATDPAYARLQELITRFQPGSKAASVELLIAGKTSSCSQKLHNLLFAYHQAPEGTEALVFADSDAYAGPEWLSHIVYPLRQKKNGAAGGYRCFVPQKNNLATIALAAVNAKICQLLGNTPFNLAWGGSMAILTKNFRELGIDKTWEKALSDDLSLSKAVRSKGLKMVFVPACMIASYESTTWPQLWEFARRQFIITRIYAPKMWTFALFSSLFTVVGLWGGLALGIWAYITQYSNAGLCVVVPAVFLSSQLVRAILRQRLIAALLPEETLRLRAVFRSDLLFFWGWSILLLLFIVSSAVGRVITWRGIRYRLNSPLNISILKDRYTDHN